MDQLQNKTTYSNIKKNVHSVFTSIFILKERNLQPLSCQTCALTYPLPDSVGVVTPLMVCGKHLLQHQQHTGDQAFVLSAAKLTLTFTNRERRREIRCTL